MKKRNPIANILKIFKHKVTPDKRSKELQKVLDKKLGEAFNYGYEVEKDE